MAGQMRWRSLMWVWALHQQLQRKAKLWIAQMYHCPPSDSTPGSTAGARFLQHNHGLLMERVWVLQTGLLECYSYTQKAVGEERWSSWRAFKRYYDTDLRWTWREGLGLSLILASQHPSAAGKGFRDAWRSRVSVDACRHDVLQGSLSFSWDTAHVHGKQIELCGCCQICKDSYEVEKQLLRLFV